MGRGLISFLGGLGQGGLSEYHKQMEMERQDKLDAQNAEQFALQKQMWQGQIDDANQKRADQQAIRDATKDVTPATQYDFSRPPADDTSDAVGPPTATDASQALPTRGYQVGSKFFDGAGGLADAQAYAKTQNSPMVRAQRIADAYTKIGQPEKAMEYQTKAQTFQKAQYDAGREAVYQKGLQAIQAGDFGAIGALAEPYLGGGKMAFERNAQGGVTVTQTDKDGRLVGTRPFAGTQELTQQWYASVFPDRAREAAAAEAAKRRELDNKIELEREKAKFGAQRDAAKPQITRPGDIVSANGKAVFTNPKDGSDRLSDEAINRDPAFKATLDAWKQQGLPADQVLQKANDLRTTIRNDRMVDRGAQELRQGLRSGASPMDAVAAMSAAGASDDYIKSVFARAAVELPKAATAPSPGAVKQAPQGVTASTPSPAAAPKPPPERPRDPVGDRLDEARAAQGAAASRLNGYGLRQRQQDPDGYAKAQADKKAADDAVRAARAEYDKTIPEYAHQPALAPLRK